MSAKKQLVIAVTALNNIDSPGPGIPVIRALRDCDDFEMRIIGLSYESLEPGIYMKDLVDKTYQIPYPSAGTEMLLSRLLAINDIEKIDLIIPNFDAELYNFIKISDKLKDAGMATFLPTLDQLDARDKINLFSFGKKHDFKVPEDKTIYSVDKILDAVNDFEFPIVVKGKYYEATVAYTIEQAEKSFHRLNAKWGLPVIIQQFISGSEINVAALGDGKGNMISAVPMRKLYITDKGKAWAGITLQDESLIELARRFIAATKWKGGFELEIMRTKEGDPYIMEVNPRFPAWIYLTAASGQNQPAALVKMALGENVVPYKTYEVGKMFIRYSWDLITNIDQFQQISAFGEL
jgi:carbamoyl-phosphate synthase large subunit